MMKRLPLSKIRTTIFALSFAIAIGGGTTALLAPATAGAQSFLGFPAWNRGLPENPKSGDDLTGMVGVVGLNIGETILRATAIVAVLFIIFGGFRFITANGNPSAVASAVKMIMNACIGFVGAMVGGSVTYLIWNEVIGKNTTGIPQNDPGAMIGLILDGFIYPVAGSLALVMIIVGGINYSTSMGDPGKVAKAKNTILYAIVGLVVVIFAFAITSFLNQEIN